MEFIKADDRLKIATGMGNSTTNNQVIGAQLVKRRVMTEHAKLRWRECAAEYYGQPRPPV